MGEGYRNIKAEHCPPLVEFAEPMRAVGQLQASFSTDKAGWGAEYRLLVNLKTGKVQYARYYNTPDDVPEEKP
jgi:hypothetical protein